MSSPDTLHRAAETLFFFSFFDRDGRADSPLVQDVDALFGADRSKHEGASSITFSGLLNALDGVANPEVQE